MTKLGGTVECRPVLFAANRLQRHSLHAMHAQIAHYLSFSLSVLKSLNVLPPYEKYFGP